MSRYRFELATPEDDAALRRVLARNPLPGEISLAMRRDPSFFAAAEVEGRFVQVIACRDLATGTIVGIGSRSTRDRFRGGGVVPTGYLGSLRIDPEHRRRSLVARGFQFLRELDDDDRAAVYFTSLAKGNKTAARTLLGMRAGLPEYRHAATWLTHAVPITRCRDGSGRVHVQKARQADTPDIVQFLNTVGRQRDLFAVIREADFEPGGTYRGLRVEDIHLATRGGKIVGTFALWDQRPFRQITVTHYPQTLAWLRPLLNLANSWRGLPLLPTPGEVLPCLFGSLLAIADEHQETARSLFAAAARAYAGDATMAFVGFDARSSHLFGFLTRLGTTYETSIHLVSWNGKVLDEWGTEHPIHLEEGCL